MKIRITGTRDELAQARQYYEELEKDDVVKYVSISTLYPNRGSNTLFRLYVEIEYFEVTETATTTKALMKKETI